MDVTVTNTGDWPGKEVVLVFAEIPDGRLEQPTRRLVAFAKTDELGARCFPDPACFYPAGTVSTPMMKQLPAG